MREATEEDQMAAEEEQVATEEDQMATEEDQMASEEHERASEENEMASEVDNMTSEKDNHLTCEDDNLTSEKDDHPRRRKRRGKAPAWHDDLGDREAMERAVSWNGYWAHPENVLVAMFHDDDIKVRERACEIVLELQQSQAVKEQQQLDEEGKLTVREFQAPHISLSVERNSYTDFLALVPKEDWTCPPVFLAVAEDVLRAGVAGGRSKDVFDIVGFPNNRCENAENLGFDEICAFSSLVFSE